MDKLSVTQVTVYEALKVSIREGLDSVFKTGEKLIRIRDEKLYRDEYGTFEDFCKAEYDMSRSRAYQLIDAAKIRKSLPASTMVDTERAARQLKSVPESERKEVLARAEKSGEVTAASIKEAAKPVEKVIDLDKEGNAIPECIVEDWTHADQVGKEIYSLLSKVKDIVKQGLDGKRDIAFAEIANPTLAEIDSLRYSLGQITPYSVCPSCKGKLRKTCTRCRHRGWISKFLFKNTTSEKERAKK